MEVDKMSIEHAAQTTLELLFIILMLYGFKNEKKLIKWEQKQIKKIKRFIYNLIVKMEG
jgi:hypothetical protein